MSNHYFWMCVAFVIVGITFYVFAYFYRRHELITVHLKCLTNVEIIKTKAGSSYSRKFGDTDPHHVMLSFAEHSENKTETILGDFYLKCTRTEYLPSGFIFTERMCSAIVGATSAVLIALTLEVFQEKFISKIFIAIFGSLAGLMFMKIANARYRLYKQQAFEQQTPTILDFLILAVETGMTVDRALVEVVQSVTALKPATTAELSRLCKDLSILPNREQAFDNLIGRTRSKTFKSLKTHLFQGEMYGVSISKSLRAVCNEARSNSLAQKQERARRLPVFISIPLMLLILPPIVLISTGPGFVQLMRSF